MPALSSPPRSHQAARIRSNAGALLLCAAFLLPAIVQAAGNAVRPVTPAPRVDFNRDVRPILAANCFACHGQDPTARQANLRLDLREDAVATRGGKAAIIPGKTESSLLVARVRAGENSPLLMPPPSSGHHLTADQQETLTRWVRQGAPYAVHWAFVPVSRPALPPVKEATWPRSPLDRFVLARLEAQGLKPAPEADRATLIRRVSLDLIGLPPTPEEVAQFIDDRSPNAYEKVVDRLLASPRYGEHWARMWLDLARYADTQGYEKDQARTIWRYRDWVIDAFNRDTPYDQFTVEQLAGDLLPASAQGSSVAASPIRFSFDPQDALLASAFHRNTMTNTEGGVDGEEFRVTAVKDRVDTTGQVWMGLTIGCAKCHSHKYDPITQQDYYRFYALFNQTEDANRGDEFPTERIPTADQQQRLAALDAKLSATRESLAKRSPDTEAAQRTWEQKLAATRLWAPLRYESATATSGAAFRMRNDDAVLVSGAHAEQDSYTLTLPLSPGRISSLRLEALKDPSLPRGGPGRDAADQNVVTSEITVEQIDSAGKRSPVALANPRADFEQSGWPVKAAVDGNPETGWAFSPQNGQPHVAVFDLQHPIEVTAGKLAVTLRQNYRNLQLGCFRLSVSAAEPALLHAELRTLAEVAAVSPEKRSADERKRLDEAFGLTHEPTASQYRALQTLEKERAELEAAIPRTPVMHELPKEKQRVTHLHRRGNFLDPGDVVEPAVPAAFGSLPPGAPANRLGAALWLVSPNNPLTARVAVNRIWARLFGTGIVETEEDFGTQGTPPTHPLLLDWLASEYAAAAPLPPHAGAPASSHNAPGFGWSTKQLLRAIVLSATYRQASTVTAEKLRKDPRNLLFSRGPRFRLLAEVIRDQALAVSGLLSAKMHGPSVMPPQPDGLWKTVYSGLKWQTSPGEDRYRRSLYTFWRRTSPYPSLTTFDAGSGEFCVVRRVRTNTPLQALVTLNDPAFVEAAGALGKAIASQPVISVRERLAYGFRRVLGRAPAAAELARLQRLYETTLAGYRARPDIAKSLLAAANTQPAVDRDPAELAAYTVTANVLLNLDETLTKP